MGLAWRDGDLGWHSCAFDTLDDPVIELFAEALVSAEVKAAECLRFSKQCTYVFDRRCVQISHGQVQMVQLSVVLYKVFEA